MSDVPEKVPVASPSLSAAVLEILQELIPGAVADGVLDAQRIAEAVGLQVAGSKSGAERFGLVWAGKGKAVEALQVQSMASLSPDLKESINWDSAENVFIEGDNLEVLKLLQKAYNDQVKLIYIDPPYNTGNDFVYNDDFSDPLKHYLEVTNQVDSEGNRLVANTEVSGRKHSNWLSMMYPRLVLARNLLTDEGLFAISIDQNEVANLVSLLNEVFGEENQIAIVAVVNNLKGRSDAEYIATAHEYLLLYARTKFRTRGLPLPLEIQDTYKMVDDLGKYRLLPLRKSGTNSLRSDRPNMFYPIYGNSKTGTVSLVPKVGFVEVYPLFPDGREGRWRWGIDTARQKVEFLFAKSSIAGKVDIHEKDYLGIGEEQRRAKPKSVWLDKKFTSDLGTYQVKELLGEGIFDHPKPLGLMLELLEISLEPGELVLDFFAGSGTTGHAVYLKNQATQDKGCKFVLVNLPESIKPETTAFKKGYKNVAEITRRRLRAVIDQLPSAKAQGLRCLRLSGSSFIDTTPIEGQLFAETLNLKADDDAITAEVLLKSGVRLDMPWHRTKLEGAPIVVSDGVAVVLARKITNDVVADTLNLEDVHTVVFLEDAFSGQDAVKANAHFAFKNANKTMKSM